MVSKTELVKNELSRASCREILGVTEYRSKTLVTVVLNVDDKCENAEARRRWRVLVLLVKAKLEAVASGETSVRDEFMANIVLLDGRTMGEWATPHIMAACQIGAMPVLHFPTLALPQKGGA